MMDSINIPISIVLPIPVSINRAYRNSLHGRAKTTAALEWHDQARKFAVPFINENWKICEKNILTRRKYLSVGKKGKPGISLSKMKCDFPDLAYGVSYTFHFANDTIRDIFNFEKLMTDLLVECGFMLDDSFIVDGRVQLGKINPTAPHVEIEIISLDRKFVI